MKFSPMKSEVLVTIFGMVFLFMLLIVIFNHPSMQTATTEALHEIKTADIWQSAAYTPAAFPYPNGVQGNYPQYQVQSFTPQDFNQPAALTGMAQTQDPDKPVLIKKFGAEVLPISGGKVKITGVMGNSWAAKAGLLPGDILLSFNTKEITDLKQFMDLVMKAPPEIECKVVLLRNGQKKKALIMIGEGEMDGFLPIVVPK